jgi:hypothetical protein
MPPTTSGSTGPSPSSSSRKDAGDDARARFRREARAASRVTHPNVVQVLDFGSWEDADYLVMELVTGRTLSHVLHDGPVEAAHAVAITRALLDALHAIHDAGIVHRDVKPGNVLLGERDVVKLMDFGIAKTAGGATLTAGNQAVGTPAYMAPEQLLGDDVDGRADLYAVGVTLFAMLVGDVPFGQTSFTRVAVRHLHDAPPLDALPPSVPPTVIAALRRALAKTPADRFADARAFAAALAGDRNASPPVAEPASDGPRTVADRPSGRVAPDRRAPDRRTRVAAVAALVVPVVAVAGYFAYDTIDRPVVAPVDAAQKPAPVVDAAAAPAPTDSARVADDQLQLARDAENRGDLELAIAAYREAYAAHPGADPLYRIADLEDRLDRKADAARDLRRYLEAAPHAADRDRVQARIAALDPPTPPPAPVAPVVKHHCICTFRRPGFASAEGMCFKARALGNCRCLLPGDQQMCLDPPVACANEAGCSMDFVCRRTSEPGRDGAACKGYDDGRPPSGAVQDGHYACTYCGNDDAFAWVGNRGDACTGYDYHSGARRTGTLDNCH